VYAANWLKLDYTDAVASLDGSTGLLTLGDIINGLSAKTNPADTDNFSISDSEDGNSSKKLSFLNLKNTITSALNSIYLALSGGSLSGALNEAKGDDIASATTTDIGAATGNYVMITGTTTITGFGTIQAGTRREVEFTGALTLTHNGTSLILPTSANITTAAGDTATFVSLGSGNWKCLGYHRKDGTSLVSAGSLAYWTESFSSSAPNTPTVVSKLIPVAPDTNIDAVISPKGSGALLANQSDSASTGGNKRGTYSVDLQLYRTAASQVASGAYATIPGGQRNTVSGDYSFASGFNNNVSNYGSGALGESNVVSGYDCFAFGESHTVTNSYSAVFGRQNNASAAYTNAFGYYASSTMLGQETRASGRFSTQGDAQISRTTPFIEITGTAQTELVLAGFGSNKLALASTNRMWHARISVLAVTSTVGNGTGVQGDCYAHEQICVIKKIGTTTSLVGAVQDVITAIADTSMSTSVFTVDADDTNDLLRVRFTPPSTAGSTTVTRVMSRVELVEVSF